MEDRLVTRFRVRTAKDLALVVGLGLLFLGLHGFDGWAQAPEPYPTSPESNELKTGSRKPVQSLANAPLREQPRLRRPVSLVLDEEARRLFVANRQGSISVIDTEALEVAAEVSVAQRLADLGWVPASGGNADVLLALDEEAHELLVLKPSLSKVEVLHRVVVSPYPVTLSVDEEGRRCFVLSLWSRRLDLVDLSKASGPRLIESVELPFAPREQVLVSDRDRLVVADAFAGRLAIIDLPGGNVEKVLELPGHNIRGLAVSSDGSDLLIAQQSLDRASRTNRHDIVWGVLMSNVLVSLPLQDILASDGNLLHAMRTLHLGEPSGDPGQVIVASSGDVMVALAGVGRMAIGRHTWPRLDHVRVGKRPVDLVSDQSGRAYVANMFSDSVSVIDSQRRKSVAEIPLGPQPALSDADRGELLFYDAKTSLRGWMSCHSCHTDGHTSGIVADTLGDGGYGAPKRVPSLLGVGTSGPWAWDGSMRALEDQIRKSLKTTLHAEDVSGKEVHALEAFLRTLEPPRLPAVSSENSIRRGEQVFHRYRCHRCHAPPAYTSKGARDVGLSDEAGNRRFNAPSLRGVEHRPTFFHDGRARNLREVFSVYEHPGLEILPSEIDDLLAFLSTLH